VPPGLQLPQAIGIVTVIPARSLVGRVFLLSGVPSPGHHGLVWISTTRGPRLAAELQRCTVDAIIVMAHGFCSDRRSRGRFDRLTADFVARGWSVLAFDFSGCGQSDDDVVTAAGEVEDLRAVLAFVRAEGYTRTALYGHSLGASICLQAYDDSIRTMVLTGAATDAMHYDWSAYYSAEQLDELETTGFMRDGRHVLSRQTLAEFGQRDQKASLSRIKCPVLLVHGGSADDAEEQELLKRSREGFSLLPAGSRLAVVEGSGHGFEQHMAEVSALACGWYAEHLRQ
jgi:pimeloyl-ACP methyl ester carboxylesterase